VATTDIDRREFLRRSAAAVAGTALCSGLAGAFLDPVAAAARRNARRKELASFGRCSWGAHALQRAGEPTAKEAILDLEGQVGRQFEIFRRYAFWDSKIPDRIHQWAAESGRTPYISWHAYNSDRTIIPWASIAAGEQDAIIRSTAQSLSGFGYPILFGFHHEPENDLRNGSADDYRQAWKRVRGIFDEIGASNLTWVAALMASTYAGGHGGSQVWLPEAGSYHLVGADGYNWWRLQSRPKWRTFAEIFAPARASSIALSKGLLIAEYGSLEQTYGGYPGDPAAKGAWFNDAANTIKAWPEVKGAIYSHASNWWVDSSTPSLDAFRSVGHDFYFAP
jgi:hypothetical protein